VKAAAFIASTPNPLEALLHISQDFPKYSAALARNVNITDAVQNRIDYMERRGQVDAAIYVNGKSVMAEEITAFSYVPP
jgi:UDP-glucose:glycoprotein glucosyltransferase